jgi:sigma-E factor negative regulatory protein RseA
MKQQLSALIDGESDLDRCEHILLAAQSDGEVAKAWREYHLIGDIMRQEAWQSGNMTNRVLQALEQEPTVLAPALAKQSANQRAEQASKQKPVVWSIAASVAATLFVGLFVWNMQSSPELEPMQIADNANDYVNAHHAYAPSSATYYVHNVAYAE